MKHSKQIQIPENLFIDICQYFLFDKKELEPRITKGLSEKLDRHIQHNLYTQFKTANSSIEREKARIEYLNERGISDSFRW